MDEYIESKKSVERKIPHFKHISSDIKSICCSTAEHLVDIYEDQLVTNDNLWSIWSTQFLNADIGENLDDYEEENEEESEEENEDGFESDYYYNDNPEDEHIDSD